MQENLSHYVYVVYIIRFVKISIKMLLVRENV